jgi:hypothetical protein
VDARRVTKQTMAFARLAASNRRPSIVPIGFRRMSIQTPNQVL